MRAVAIENQQSSPSFINYTILGADLVDLRDKTSLEPLKANAVGSPAILAGDNVPFGDLRELLSEPLGLKFLSFENDSWLK